MTEYTACLARGGCLLVTRRAVEVGSLFRFEMVCQEQAEAVELEGEVVRVRPIHGDTMSYELAVQYRSHTAQAALEELLARIGTDDTHSHQIVRRFPRIPVNLPAEDSQGLGRRYLIRDLSAGGAEPLVLRGAEGWVTAAVFSPDDRVLAIATDQQVHLFDAASG
ncbi:MAG TPA: PilZ domain-containing protein, partial [Kofleriaceae bacterium]|nr:PilZ domain-containing protein [Kofleriaceae bacterium]